MAGPWTLEDLLPFSPRSIGGFSRWKTPPSGRPSRCCWRQERCLSFVCCGVGNHPDGGSAPRSVRHGSGSGGSSWRCVTGRSIGPDQRSPGQSMSRRASCGARRANLARGGSLRGHARSDRRGHAHPACTCGTRPMDSPLVRRSGTVAGSLHADALHDGCVAGLGGACGPACRSHRLGGDTSDHLMMMDKSIGKPDADIHGILIYRPFRNRTAPVHLVRAMKTKTLCADFPMRGFGRHRRLLIAVVRSRSGNIP